jgi:hypothetical protein
VYLKGLYSILWTFFFFFEIEFHPAAQIGVELMILLPPLTAGITEVHHHVWPLYSLLKFG